MSDTGHYKFLKGYNLRIIFSFIFVFILVNDIKVKAQLMSQDNEKVKIYLSWTHQFQFAGYYAAIEKGYFQARGLDVELVENTTNDDVEGAIIDGEYKYGVGTAGLLLANKEYKKIAILAAIFQQSAVSLIALKSNGINSLRDLAGSDIVGSIETKAMLKSARVDIDNVRFHGKKVSFADLVSGKYDAISFYITDQALLLGNDSLLFNIFRPLEYGINFYGECLYANREEIDANPERAIKMRDAVIEGWQYTVDHPEEIIEIIREKYNPGLTRNELAGEADITINKLIRPLFYDIGDMQKSKWVQMAKVLFEFGVIDSTRDIDSFIYSSSAEESENLKLLLKITSAIISVSVIILLIMFLYSRQLKKAVKIRTASLEKANSEMDRFVYSISHDIRSPLSSVQGLINIIKIDDSEFKKYLGLIESSIQKLDSYTKDILDYTRNSRAKLKLGEVDLKEIIEKCIGQIKYANNSKNIDFETEVRLEEAFCTDAWRLEVILNNLLSNSIKYRDNEKEKSFVKITAKSNSSELEIIITDNGIGIDQQHLDKIYDMFYRASEDSQGSGLGLYIVRETINMLKGSIEISSMVGEGTTIRIELPNSLAPD